MGDTRLRWTGWTVGPRPRCPFKTTSDRRCPVPIFAAWRCEGQAWQAEFGRTKQASKVSNIYINIYICGFPKMVVPPFHTPKWSFLVGKSIVVGYHHFRNPPYIIYLTSKNMFETFVFAFVAGAAAAATGGGGGSCPICSRSTVSL